jgi:hypothetical protein
MACAVTFRLTWPGTSIVVGEGLVDIRVAWRGRWLVVREDEAPPAVDGTIRAEGLWLSLVCETPGEHWSVAMEAFALAVDDPAEDRGDLVPLGFDVEWEAPGQVHGELLVGDEVLPIDGPGALELDA